MRIEITKKNIDSWVMYHCENCKVDFVAIQGNQFCYRCNLLAMWEIEDTLPF